MPVKIAPNGRQSRSCLALSSMWNPTMNQGRLQGLVAAANTPFHEDGSLNLAAVEPYAAHLLRSGMHTVFIAGSTGESHSLSMDERRQLARRWAEVVRGTKLRLVVHVGSNCVSDARLLAAESEKLGAAAIAALAPAYFKPRSLDMLIATLAEISSAAPRTPFYFYDIPALTNVNFSMPDLLHQAAGRLPMLAGIKFTNSDLMSYQLCLRADAGRWDVPWGIDQSLLGALAVGATGAVGSSYNLAPKTYQRLWEAFDRGDMAAAREEQFRSVRLIELLVRYDYMGAAKATMGMIGIPVGPVRLPLANPDKDQLVKLRRELESLGFFDKTGNTYV
jgi:N-acetylneuraminate lyase